MAPSQVVVKAMAMSKPMDEVFEFFCLKKYGDWWRNILSGIRLLDTGGRSQIPLVCTKNRRLLFL